MGALHPAAGDGELAPKRGVVPAKPYGDACGRHGVAALAIQAICAFPCGEHEVSEIEPPSRERETFEYFRLFLSIAQRDLERTLGVRPRAPRECCTARLEGHRWSDRSDVARSSVARISCRHQSRSGWLF